MDRFRSIALITALGFSSGLPLALSGFTLRLWLTRADLPLAAIGFTANLGIAYSLKFLWAPALDQVRAPRPFRALGRRRSWLLLIQLVLAAAIGGLALTHPAHDLAVTLVLGGLVAFFSASQDIMIDTWRIEFFPLHLQGAATAGYVWGYRAAMLVSGSGVIALSVVIGWHEAILLMVPLQLVGAAATLLCPEPVPPQDHRPVSIGARFRDAVVAPLAAFLQRRGAVLILAFVVLFYLGEALAGVMLAPYYTHLGFNRAVIALATGPAALVAVLAGTALGGVLVARAGVGRALLAALLFQTMALLLYPVLGLYPHLPHILLAVSVVEAFAQGISDAAFITFLSGLCNKNYTATQYALLSSVAALALRTVGGFSGVIAQALGWIRFYEFTVVSALPAVVVLLVILRKYPIAAAA
ncbi:AmpG family muropeptide MFS transporter [Acidiphilium sp.]|uniref:AmpG family muropeptide MFS transporter n=1 Tax=Acidiphilium sp. TaxID=527 RepID=UPI003CFF8435